MKPFIFGIAALLVGLPAQSETIYLVFNIGMEMTKSLQLSTFTLPMDTLEQCEIAGAKLLSSNRFLKKRKPKYRYSGFECILGK